MTNTSQDYYLEQLGITVWKARAEPDTVNEEPVVQLIEETPVESKSQEAETVAAEITENTPVSVSEEIRDHSDENNMVVEKVSTGAQMGWKELEAAVSGCHKCDLCASRTNTVFGVGNRNADLLVIGEAPGADEDAQGEPFVGRAGKLLDNMLLAIGHDRSTVFIANILKCRPPNNRDPLAEEVNCCVPYLKRQIELIRPKLILTIGRIAAQNLLESQMAIGKMRGKEFTYGDSKIPVIVSYHPAYLLRSPGAKAEAWKDLKRVSAFLKSGLL